MLRFDGLYVGPAKTAGGDARIFFDYLRFYEDGSVICRTEYQAMHVSISVDPTDLSDWLIG